MPTEQALEGTNDLMLGAVERQRVDTGSANGGDSHQFIARPSKMMVPLLLIPIRFQGSIFRIQGHAVRAVIAALASASLANPVRN